MNSQSSWTINYSTSRRHDDAMDIDEQILNDVANLRASTKWEIGASPTIQFEDPNSHTSGTNHFVVLDSNVLISYLPLVKEMLATISRTNLRVVVCLPNVVVVELNYLKEKNPNPNTRALAQEANVWLLAQVRTRNGLVRGQQKHERLEQASDTKRVNDDLIIDYCQYLLSKAQNKPGVVSLLSNDQNCCLKAELQGILTISPKPRMTSDGLLSIITGSKTTNDSSASKLPYAATSSLNSHQPHHQSVEGSMEVDEDDFISPSASHPLSVLHRQLIEHLCEILRPLAYDAALLEQAKRGADDAPAPVKKSGMYTSIHAPKSPEPVVIMRRFIMPKYDEVLTWSCLDCIHFTLEFPPTAVEGTRPKHHRRPTIAKLDLFLRPHDVQGGRKGKDWAVGDWMQALEELEQVATYCGWTDVQGTVDICHKQLNAILQP